MAMTPSVRRPFNIPGDCNQDGGIDLSDAVYKLAFLFQGGNPPVQGQGCTDIPDCPWEASAALFIYSDSIRMLDTQIIFTDYSELKKRLLALPGAVESAEYPFPEERKFI
jgi:hypothetical protein